jgi:hypothetical protein
MAINSMPKMSLVLRFRTRLSIRTAAHTGY